MSFQTPFVHKSAYTLVISLAVVASLSSHCGRRPQLLGSPPRDLPPWALGNDASFPPEHAPKAEASSVFALHPHRSCQGPPVEIGSPFATTGWRARFDSPYHTGIHSCSVDYNWGASGNSDCGQRLLAACSGSLRCWDTQGGWGLRCDIHCQDHRSGVRITYAHLQHFQRASGQVKEGDPIGSVGTTGTSTHCHLHLACYANGHSVPFRLGPSRPPKPQRDCVWHSQVPDASRYPEGRYPITQGRCESFGIFTRHTGAYCLSRDRGHKHFGALLSTDVNGRVVPSFLCSPKWSSSTGSSDCTIAALPHPDSQLCTDGIVRWQSEMCVPKGRKIGDVNVYFAPGFPQQGMRLMSGCSTQGIHIPLRIFCPAHARVCEGDKLLTCSRDRRSWLETRCAHGCSNGRCKAPAHPPKTPTLSSFHPGCSHGSLSTHRHCTSAAFRWCRAKLNSSGVAGLVVETDHPRVGVACIKTRSTQTVRFDELKQLHGACDRLDRSQDPSCLSAMSRWCTQHKGVPGGLALEGSKDWLVVGCFPGKSAGDVSVDRLKRHHGGCDHVHKSAKSQCISAAHRFCAASKFGTGYIKETSDAFGVLCLDASYHDTTID